MAEYRLRILNISSLLPEKEGAHVGAMDCPVTHGTVAVSGAADVMKRRGLACGNPRRETVTFQAKLMHVTSGQHQRVDRTVTLVTFLTAVYRHRSMFEGERPPLVDMTGHASKAGENL